MKRDKENCKKLVEIAKKDMLLSKQLTEIGQFAVKDQAPAACRLGRMHGLYFSENDWISTWENLSPMKKPAKKAA